MESTMIAVVYTSEEAKAVETAVEGYLGDYNHTAEEGKPFWFALSKLQDQMRKAGLKDD
jgi:hypothetical protein